MDQMFAKWGGGEVLRRAVKGMLPKNRLQDSRLARLKSKFVLMPEISHDSDLAYCYPFLVALANISSAAFEGADHPYKDNIVKFGNQSVIGNLSEVQEAFKVAATKPTA